MACRFFPRTIHTLALGGAMTLLTAGAAIAQAPKPDNTAVNTRDRQPGAITADQQKNDVADREATRKIRASIVRDKGLSTYAHNVKIVTRDGHVTLKGPVRSEAEKHAVEAKAIEVAGSNDRVVSEISIAPETKRQ